MARTATKTWEYVLGLLALAGLIVPEAAAELLFRTPEAAIPHASVSLAAADLDGDGDPDLVAGAESGDRISVLLNLGDGRFAGAETYQSGSRPRYVALGDIDNDGDPDILAGNSGDGTLTVLWNNGDGTFQDATSGAVSYPVGMRPQWMKTVDLDGDDVPEVIVSRSNISAGELWLNDGSGGLMSTSLGYLVFGIDTADVDGDGDPDLVSTAGGEFRVALNDGAGGLGPPSEVGLAGGPFQAVALGDLDGDGDPDAVTIDFDAASGEVVVLTNDGSGNFTLGPRYFAGYFPWDVLVADFNADGLKDVATVSGIAPGDAQLSILLNDGAGGLLAAVSDPVEPLAASIVGADFDGDGALDLAIPVSPEDLVAVTSSIRVVLGDGQGDFGGHARVRLPDGSQPRGVAGGDLDGDDDPDLVVTESESDRFVTFVQEAGTFVEGDRGFFGSGIEPGSVVVADLDADTDLDIAVAGGSLGEFGVALNLGAGLFDDSAAYCLCGRHSVMEAADFNGDTAPDLVFTKRAGDTVGAIEVRLNDGSGLFLYPAESERIIVNTERRPEGLATGDVDLDGDPDVVVVHRFGEVMLAENLGGAVFAPAVTIDTLGFPVAALLEDLNGDLAPELVVADVDADAVLVFTNLGGGGFGAPVSYLVGEDPFALAAGDVDLDGVMDLVAVNQSPRAEHVTVLLGDGGGAFVHAGDFAVGRGALSLGFTAEGDDHIGNAVALIDIDRDADLDIVVANAGDETVSLLENRLIRPEFEGAILGPFETATTDTEGDGATPTDPVETTVRTPTGGAVLISEGPISSDAPRGFSFFGHEVNIQAPPASVANPLIITFQLDASQVPPGITAFSTRVFRNSMLVGACLGAPGAADPDPCIASRLGLPDGDILIEVRTSLASRWNLGLQDPLSFVIAADFTSNLGLDRVVFSIPAWKWQLLIDQVLDVDQDGSESMPAAAGGMEASGTGDLLGEVTMRLRGPNDSPFQASLAELEEPFNQVPHLLEMPPFASTTGGQLSLRLFLEFDIPSFGVAHNETALAATGAVGAWPPFLDQQLFGGSFIPLFDEQGGASGVAVTGLRAATGLQSPPPRVQDLDWALGKNALSWSDDPNAVAFNVYEGHRSTLSNLTGGALDSCLKKTVQVTSAGGLENRPAPGELFWYLVTPVGPFEEGEGGTSSFGPRQVDSTGTCGTSCSHGKCSVSAPLEPACDVCVATICAADPYCCDTEWDSVCVESVRTACDNLTCPESQGQCMHPLCALGGPLGAGCDVPPLDTSCVDIVCGADSFCCGNSWDEVCVAAVTDLCEFNCDQP